MTRRKLLRLLALPALAAFGAAGYARLRPEGNPYYQGPRSDHFDGLRFFVPGGPEDKGLADLMRWHLGGDREPWPDAFPSPYVAKPEERVAGTSVTLIGHASLLVQVAGLNLLIDPVYGERASPVSFAGPSRVNPPGLAFADLPPIDAVLVTHNHYDHLDVETLSRLWHRFRPRILAPLGNDAIIRAHDPAVAVEARDWGESVALSDAVTAHLVPAYHWSARSLSDKRMALWCAFVLTTPRGAIYHVGDTGYGTGAIFREVRERFAPRLAILPIGAYAPRWFMRTQHVDPAEAVRIMGEVGAEQALGHHWGTFRLTNEGIEDPPRDLARALAAAGIPPERFRALRPGETWAGPAGA